MLPALALLPASRVPANGRSGAEHSWVSALARRHRGHGITSMCQGSGRAADDLGEARVASTGHLGQLEAEEG